MLGGGTRQCRQVCVMEATGRETSVAKRGGERQMPGEGMGAGGNGEKQRGILGACSVGAWGGMMCI